MSTKVTHHLDVLGFYCPVPLHEMKKGLEQLDLGDVMKVIADDPETLHDIPMYLGRTNHILHDVINSSGEFAFIIEVSR
jgi:TusA-related sulfurtransferase